MGILSKVRHFVNSNILIMLHYSFIYSFLAYGVHVWGLTFPLFLTPLFVIQKKAIRIISFSEPGSHSEPLFKSFNLLNLNDIIKLQVLSFIYQWPHRMLPHVSVCILNSHHLFIPIQHADHVMEIFT